MERTRTHAPRAALLTAAAAALLCASCARSCGGAPSGDAQDAGADAAPAELPAGARACGHPAATPAQVAREFLAASQQRDVQSMLACFKPKHRETMAKRSQLLTELTVISFTLGAETIDGDTAQVAANVERYDGRGHVERKLEPMRLERVEGVWYLR
ncbi:MAG: hypothetical protein IT372_23545 [Polyangiaceae bacterium]|nr:hypothetical protein [Polyangiaceae bacterium]